MCNNNKVVIIEVINPTKKDRHIISILFFIMFIDIFFFIILKYFQNSNNGYIYLDKLDELLDNSIAAVGDNLQMQMDNICVIREMYKLLKCITEAGKEIDHD